MEFVSNPVVQMTLGKISEAFKSSPKNFHEFEQFVRSSTLDFLGTYAVQKLEYSLAPSPEMRFLENIPNKTIIFGDDDWKNSEKVNYIYPIMNGEVHFEVFLDRKLPDDEMYTLELIIRQLFYVLQTMVMDLSFHSLVVNDYGMGIANLQGFMGFAGKLIAQGRIGEYSALFFNIHNFKSVHKELNYVEGNDVLANYCRIVGKAVSKNEIVARLGGDNFVALILHENRDYFMDLIQNMVVSYVRRNGTVFTFNFGATAGASVLDEIHNPGEIMMRISSAYQYTRENKMQFAYYDPRLAKEIIDRKNVLSNFNKALNNGEFFAVYQPKVDVKSRKLIGAEALCRWRTESGCSMPSNFISILEADGCITALDFFMLEQVCILLSKLFREGVEPVKVSVNFSKRHLTNNKLVEEIVEVIDRYEIPHRYVEVELTEGEDFRNNTIMESVVDNLSDMGIKTSIDDFGTGYSSLGLLKTLSIDVLKIDKSFIPVSPFDENDKSYLMLQGVVSLAKSLGLSIVAEGVETPEQLELVENMGCDIVQGYIFDKPLSESDFIDRIKRKVYPIDN